MILCAPPPQFDVTGNDDTLGDRRRAAVIATGPQPTKIGPQSPMQALSSGGMDQIEIPAFPREQAD